jgi:Family of unknown function (DUF6516)
MPKAKSLIDERVSLAPNMFVELVVWQVPQPVPGSHHQFKYSLALVVDEKCILRYDNEAGKGDHRHLGNKERLYNFVDVETLLKDFQSDVAAFMEKRK